VTPKRITRRAAVQAAVAIVAVPAAAHVVEPESDVRPVLPFSEEQARALTLPRVQPMRGD
jgi:hypothetical protein